MTSKIPCFFRIETKVQQPGVGVGGSRLKRRDWPVADMGGEKFVVMHNSVSLRRMTPRSDDQGRKYLCIRTVTFQAFSTLPPTPTVPGPPDPGAGKAARSEACGILPGTTPVADEALFIWLYITSTPR